MFQMVITTKMAGRAEKHVCLNFYLKLKKIVPETDKIFKTDFEAEIFWTAACMTYMFCLKN
jgi:hypothetical protein